MRNLRARTSEERAELAKLPLKEYYQSVWWRVRRSNVLEAKRFQCERCHATQEIEVHHVSYDRLGAEQDRDLEVICHQCHTTLHATAAKQQDIRAYLHLAQETVRLDQPTTMADLETCLRARCRDLKLPLDSRLDRAVAEIGRGMARLVPSSRRAHVAAELPAWRDLPDLKPEEARTLFGTVVDRLARDLDAPHSLKHLIKSMPKIYTHDSAHEARVRAQADEWRGRGDDPAADRKRERDAAAAERIAWERAQGAK